VIKFSVIIYFLSPIVSDIQIETTSYKTLILEKKWKLEGRGAGYYDPTFNLRQSGGNHF